MPGARNDVENNGSPLKYTDDVPKWKRYIFEPFLPRDTPFQSHRTEVLDDLLGLCTCLFLLIASMFASTTFFYWKDTGKSPTMWPQTSDTDLIPQAAVDNAQQELKETFDASRAKRSFLMARNAPGAGKANSIHETMVTPRLKYMALILILVALVLAYVAALRFCRAMREYETEKNPDEEKARQTLGKRMWNLLRWLPCCPTLIVSFYWIYLFYKIQRMKFVIGNALWLAVAAFVFNLLWLFFRLFRVWKVYKWVKAPIVAGE